MRGSIQRGRVGQFQQLDVFAKYHVGRRRRIGVRNDRGAAPADPLSARAGPGDRPVPWRWPLASWPWWASSLDIPNGSQAVARTFGQFVLCQASFATQSGNASAVRQDVSSRHKVGAL